jgi:single-stranded DNA-binding protein
MSAHVLVTGSLFRAPEQRTSQSGKRYTVATIKAAGADNAPSEFWSVLCFSDTGQKELLRLGLNEKLAVQGALRIETYSTDGETRISRTVFADSVLALRAPPKEKKPKPSGQTTTQARPPLERVNIMPRASSDLDDDEIPF